MILPRQIPQTRKGFFPKTFSVQFSSLTFSTHFADAKSTLSGTEELSSTIDAGFLHALTLAFSDSSEIESSLSVFP